MRTSTPLLLLALLPACGLAALGDYHDALDARESEGGSSSGGTGSFGTSGITVTATSLSGGDSDGSTSTGSEPEAPGSTGSTPAGPPTIIQVELGPSPIHQNGPIGITVEADNADGVRMLPEDGDAIELLATDEGTFIGEVAALTGLDNGEHTISLSPWRGDVEGIPAQAAYEIDLPTPGAEAFWETGDTIGSGFVAALGLLPGGDVLELGTRYAGNDPQCYLRRRDKSGAWWKADVVKLLDGESCTAIDLQVANDGTTYLLLLRHDNGVARWWLGELPSWGATTKNLRLGNPGEEAVALALHGEEVAVCGSVPNGFDDGKDAAAWLHRPGQAGAHWTFDYAPKEPGHQFGETTRDCVFAGDELVMVGEAFGFHEYDQGLDWDRHFILRFAPLTKEESWFVATSSLGVQSGATAVAVDDEGRLLTAGYRCDADCAPMGMLQVHDGEGLMWHADIGAWPTKGFAARDLRWSPAGYAVVASGGPSESEAAFVIRAYAPLEDVAPLWTYTRLDAKVAHMALAMAIGPYGELWAAGFGASGYPAVAQISG